MFADIGLSSLYKKPNCLERFWSVGKICLPLVLPEFLPWATTELEGLSFSLKVNYGQSLRSVREKLKIKILKKKFGLKRPKVGGGEFFFKTPHPFLPTLSRLMQLFRSEGLNPIELIPMSSRSRKWGSFSVGIGNSLRLNEQGKTN